MKRPYFLLPRALTFWATALLGVTAVCRGDATQTAPIGLPAPLALRADASAGLQYKVVWQGEGHIEALALGGKTLPPDFTTQTPVGPDYTLSFWVRAQPSPLLEANDFTPETPVTIADVSPLSDRSRQRLVLRVMNGYFMATEQNDGKWASLKGFDLKLVPERWYFVCYVRTGESGILYVNGDRVLRTLSVSKNHAAFQRFVFGHFDKTRPFPGELLCPRVYKAALTDAQIQTLYKAPPAAAR